MSVHIVGYKGRTVAMFAEITEPNRSPHDPDVAAGSDLANPEANDQRLVLYGDIAFRARPGRTYTVTVYLADKFRPGSPNLDQREVNIAVDRRGNPRLRRPCARGAS